MQGKLKCILTMILFSSPRITPWPRHTIDAINYKLLKLNFKGILINIDEKCGVILHNLNTLLQYFSII